MAVRGVEIITDGVTDELTVIVIAFEVAGLPVTQVAFEVIIQVTILPVANVEEVYVDPLPTTEEPTFH